MIKHTNALINTTFKKECVNKKKTELGRFLLDLKYKKKHNFRLTPNLSELITNVGVSGPFTASMIATARCLTHPSFKIQVRYLG